MSDPLRTDISREVDTAPDADREAKIEQLLLGGLEHYFAGRYDQAINVWTRALFLDRSHARARAYIERARTAQAERQRESEELLQHGVTAFGRGDSVEARRLLEAALAQGAPSDQALAVLDRVNRLEQGLVGGESTGAHRRRVAASAAPTVRSRPSRAAWAALATLSLVIIGAAAFAGGAFRSEWRSILRRPPTVAATTAYQKDQPLPLPRRGELALARARTLVASGHLREALVALDRVATTDAQKAEADRLRAQIQHQLIDLVAPAANPETARTGAAAP